MIKGISGLKRTNLVKHLKILSVIFLFGCFTGTLFLGKGLQIHEARLIQIQNNFSMVPLSTVTYTVNTTISTNTNQNSSVTVNGYN